MKSIAFIPYYGHEAEYELGFYNLWTYEKFIDKYVPNENVSRKICELFSCYYERRIANNVYQDVPLTNILVITPKDYANHYTLSEVDCKNISSIAHILSFCSTVEGSVIQSTSDAFQLEILNFSIDSQGYLIYGKVFTDLKMVKFLKPYQVVTSLAPNFPTDFMKSLGNALDKGEKKELNRIFKALEFYYFAAATGSFISIENRILNLLISFEILIDYEDKFDLLNKMDHYFEGISNNSSKRVIHKNYSKIEEEHHIVSWWAFDLYNLRNRIVHANDYEKELDKWGTQISQILFGGKLLKSIIMYILLENDLLIGGNFYYGLFQDYDLDEKLKELVNENKNNN